MQTLDVTGTLAAVYPSEEQLWSQGPQINAPGDQGVAYVGAGEFMGPPPVPTGAAGVQAEEQFIHDVMNGPTSNGATGLEWVNNQQFGPTGVGDWAYTVAGSPAPAQEYSGHDANIPSNPSSEQGWGVGPARRWARFPISDSPNPARNGAYTRNGDFPWVTADSWLYERTQLAWQAQWQPYKYRTTPGAVVPMAGSVPFAETVPTYGGGPSPVPGIDVPAIGPQPIYPS
jgi:hypothetical protein